MKKPSKGSSSWMMVCTASLGPATTPSSMYHLWNSRHHQYSDGSKPVCAIQSRRTWSLVGRSAGHRADDTHWMPQSRMLTITPQSRVEQPREVGTTFIKEGLTDTKLNALCTSIPSVHLMFFYTVP